MGSGQVVVGPPGSGKSTYCNGMQQFLTAAGRNVAIINLDPANDTLPYECAVNIMDLISLEEVMRDLNLGPNGGLMYCMDHLEQNLDWLGEKLEPLAKEGAYFVFDCPGQVELLTLHHSFQSILHTIQNKWHHSLEMPHINLLSKVDLIECQGELAFNLEFYSEVQDLSYLLDTMEEDLFSKRFKGLSKALCEVVEDFSMVQFTPLAIEEKESVARVVALIDKATGYVFTGLPGGVYPPEFLYGAGVTDEKTTETLMAYEEKYMKSTVEEKQTAT